MTALPRSTRRIFTPNRDATSQDLSLEIARLRCAAPEVFNPNVSVVTDSTLASRREVVPSDSSRAAPLGGGR
jgi:hypothetical protein